MIVVLSVVCNSLLLVTPGFGTVTKVLWGDELGPPVTASLLVGTVVDEDSGETSEEDTGETGYGEGALPKVEGALSESDGELLEGEGAVSEGAGALSEGAGALSEGNGALLGGEGELPEGGGSMEAPVLLAELVQAPASHF